MGVCAYTGAALTKYCELYLVPLNLCYPILNSVLLLLDCEMVVGDSVEGRA